MKILKVFYLILSCDSSVEYFWRTSDDHIQTFVFHWFLSVSSAGTSRISWNSRPCRTARKVRRQWSSCECPRCHVSSASSLSFNSLTRFVFLFSGSCRPQGRQGRESEYMNVSNVLEAQKLQISDQLFEENVTAVQFPVSKTRNKTDVEIHIRLQRIRTTSDRARL